MRLLRAACTGIGLLLCAVVPVSRAIAADEPESVAFNKLRFEIAKELNVPAGSDTGLAIRDLASGESVFEVNGNKPLKPASVLKVLTSVVALSRLGPEFRFQTGVYVDGWQGSRARTLYIRGGGDPSFTTEQMWVLVRRLKTEGITEIDRVVLDDSAFVHPDSRQGTNAYQAATSALSFNFNAITFYVCPTRGGSPARITADPWEFGGRVAGSIQTVAKGSGTFSVDESFESGEGNPSFVARGSIGQRQPCIPVYRAIKDPVQYFGSVFEEFGRLVGIKFLGPITSGDVPSQAELVFTHPSKPLSLILQDLNHFSSNFIAEQILSVLGDSRTHSTREVVRTVYDREEGIRLLEQHLRELGFSPADFHIVDGSGLSHSDRITAGMLVRLLAELWSSPEFGPEFQSSLPVALRNGTLKKRSFGGGHILVRAKTGTLDGVSSLAGYVESKAGRQYAFVVLQNGVPSKAKAETFEEKVVSTLYDP